MSSQGLDTIVREGQGAVELDDLDRKLLKFLSENARYSYRSLAKRARVSVSTVASRVARLEREGVIRGYAAILDHEKLGYSLTVLTEITVMRGKLLEMERQVSRIPSVCAVYDVTGLTDAVAIAKFRSREELSRFTKSLLSLPFIERTNSHLVLTTVKEDFRIL